MASTREELHRLVNQRAVGELEQVAQVFREQSEIRDSRTRIPGLGDIPIIGALFRGRDSREDRTELLVIITPRLVEPLNAPPALPGGEPQSWQWDRLMRTTPPDYKPPVGADTIHHSP